MRKYTRNNRKRRHSKSRRKSYFQKTRKYISRGGRRYTDYYEVSDIFLFNPNIDIFGEEFKDKNHNSTKPVYNKYTMSEWYGMSREQRVNELIKENTAKRQTPRIQGIIEPMVEYINEKNMQMYNETPDKSKLNYPYILSIPTFNYEQETDKGVVDAEIVPSPDAKDTPPAFILPDDFLRFTHRSDILNTLFPFFMKIYVNLLKDLNQDIAETDKVIVMNRDKNQEIMKFVLKTLREIHSFASPIWFNHIYNSFYDLGLNNLFKIAKDGYNNYMEKLTQSLRETDEIPMETTMYSFPSYSDCKNANCKPTMKKIIHTYLVKNGEFDKKEPVENLLNMYFFNKDGKTNAYSKLSNQMKKGPLRSLDGAPPVANKPPSPMVTTTI